jgi:hypothetical protein
MLGVLQVCEPRMTRIDSRSSDLLRCSHFCPRGRARDHLAHGADPVGELGKSRASRLFTKTRVAGASSIRPSGGQEATWPFAAL